MRGKEIPLKFRPSEEGITPAYAGKSSTILFFTNFL